MNRTFNDLRFPFLQSEVLSKWLPKIDHNICFADLEFILFCKVFVRKQ